MRFSRFFMLLVAGAWIAAGCGGSGDEGSSGDNGAGGASGASAGSGVGGAAASGNGGSGALGIGASANAGGTAGGAAAQTGAGGAAATGAGGDDDGRRACQGKYYACGDGEDNDGDGLIDMDDPDCLGPCHNLEDSFYGNIPGQAGPKCKLDCYFDSNSGPGNDDCFWNHECDPLSTAPDYPPEGDKACSFKGNDYMTSFQIDGAKSSCTDLKTKQSQVCTDYCGPLTPNGCDCFGCCELPARSGNFVWLGSEDPPFSKTPSCSLKTIDDPSKCRPCTPVPACMNPCDKLCELCLGETDLPPECYQTGTGGSPGTGGTAGTGGTGGTPGGGGTGGGCPTPFCPTGVQPCGFDCLPKCPTNHFCNTGCCVPIPT
jgi:hypothetical protein